MTNERVTSRELTVVPGLPSKGVLEEAPCAANRVSAFHTSLAVDSCFIGTTSSYVTNEHNNCGNSSTVTGAPVYFPIKGLSEQIVHRCSCRRVAI